MENLHKHRFRAKLTIFFDKCCIKIYPICVSLTETQDEICTIYSTKASFEKANYLLFNNSDDCWRELSNFVHDPTSYYIIGEAAVELFNKTLKWQYDAFINENDKIIILKSKINFVSAFH